MIQRIQSIYLFLSAIALGLMFMLPSMQFFSVKSDVYQLTYAGIQKMGTTSYLSKNVILTVFIAAVSLISLVSIFLYKNRKFQMKLGWFNIMLMMALLIYIFFTATADANTLKASLSFKMAFFMPVISCVFTFLANRAINKDEKLVKSLDRLR
jgi:hypothetical protein